MFRRALSFLYSIQQFNYKIAFCEKYSSDQLTKYTTNNNFRIKHNNLLISYAKHYNHFYINKSIHGGLFRSIKQFHSKSSHNLIIPKQTKLFPNVLFVSNLYYFHSILHESHKINLISIGLVDTNNQSLKLVYPIPCNDDNILSISFFNQLIIKSLDTSSLVFDNNYLYKVRTNLIKKYDSIFIN